MKFQGINCLFISLSQCLSAIAKEVASSSLTDSNNWNLEVDAIFRRWQILHSRNNKHKRYKARSFRCIFELIWQNSEQTISILWVNDCDAVMETPWENAAGVNMVSPTCLFLSWRIFSCSEDVRGWVFEPHLYSCWLFSITSSVLISVAGLWQFLSERQALPTKAMNWQKSGIKTCVGTKNCMEPCSRSNVPDELTLFTTKLK